MVTGVLAAVLVLGFLIIVHEFGHFLIAKRSGVGVLKFSIGFGPRLFGWKRGATDYRVSAVPLGGYVRMAGQDLSDIDSGKQAPTGAPDELMSKPRWQRAVICLGGPIVNLLFAFPLLFALFVIFGVPHPAYFDRPLEVVRQPESNGNVPSPLRVGDRVVSLNGVSHPTWEKGLETLSQAAPGSRLDLRVENGPDHREVSLIVPEKGPDQVRRTFGERPALAVVDRVESRGPADQAGIRPDDKVLALNGRAVFNQQEFLDVVRHSNGQEVAVRLGRKNQVIETKVTPRMGANEKGEKVWVIGVTIGPELNYARVGMLEGTRDAALATVSGAGQVVVILGKLITGAISIRQLQSVVGISRESGEAFSRGTSSVLELMATLSLNLGVLNLLPIPILDGGQILLLGIEGFRRRDMSMAFKERFVQVGLVFLLALLGFVMYNDVLRIWSGR